MWESFDTISQSQIGFLRDPLMLEAGPEGGVGGGIILNDTVFLTEEAFVW